MFLLRILSVPCNRLPITSLQCIGSSRPEDTSDRITVDDNFILDESTKRLCDDKGRIDGIEDRRRRIVPSSSSADSVDLECLLKPIRKINDNSIRNSYISAASSALVMSMALFYKAARADALVLDGQYVDSVNK